MINLFRIVCWSILGFILGWFVPWHEFLTTAPLIVTLGFLSVLISILLVFVYISIRGYLNYRHRIKNTRNLW